MIVLNDLVYLENRKIYQETKWFSYSIDSILLANFTNIKKEDTILDLCSGNGVVPLYISYFNSNKIYGIELQKEVYELANKSITYNKLEEQITYYNDNISNIKNYFKHESIDVITCNPPFFKNSNQNKYNENIIKRKARHEIDFNLDIMCKCVNYVMKNTGTFYLVHRPFRLDELIIKLNDYKLIVKEIKFCYPFKDSEANMVLLKIKKGANAELKVLSPLIIHSDSKDYSSEVKEIFGGSL